MPILGCIADDAIGASEVAALFTAGGLSTHLYDTLPADPDRDADAIVVALNLRTVSPASAVEEVRAALLWLERQGCTRYYIKYSDTFACGRLGNIGPVCDAAMVQLDAPYTLLCPGNLDKDITVSCGKLYVNGVPAQDCGRNDPPLWDSDLARLMEGQSKYPCVKITHSLCRGRSQVLSTLADFSFDRHCEHFYAIPDFKEDSNPDKILELFTGLKLLTGGTGLAGALARRLAAGKD